MADAWLLPIANIAISTVKLKIVACRLVPTAVELPVIAAAC